MLFVQRFYDDVYIAHSQRLLNRLTCRNSQLLKLEGCDGYDQHLRTSREAAPKSLWLCRLQLFFFVFFLAR